MTFLSTTAAIVGRLLLALSLLTSACAASTSTIPDPTKPHHTADGFRNVYVTPETHNYIEFQWMKLVDDTVWADYQSQAHRVPRVNLDSGLPAADPEIPRATWLGHTTVLIQYRGLNILTDPIFSQRASPVSFAGPKRVTAPALSLDQLPPIDIVLISHNHYDHLDAMSVEKLGNAPTWMVPLRYKRWFADLGIDNIKEFDWWDEHQMGSATVTATPSQHWTARGLFDRDKLLWAAWSVKVDDFSFWFAGDTGYNDVQFKQTGERLGPFDLSIIPIGGYSPRWFMKDVHVNPEEAVKIHRDVRSSFSIGVHWGTFPLTAEPVYQPPEFLKIATSELEGSTFVSIAIGESREIPLRKK